MIMHIVGNRPQFIKLAPLTRELNNRGYEDRIIHTGQHYDENMSDVFFKELGIKKPYKNLNVGSGTHGEVTGQALIRAEKLMLEEWPEAVIVYGDTNTTLAGALAAKKLDIPVLHVEAGTRTFVLNNPEEVNRRMVDHISQILCCPDEESVKNLQQEGITRGVYFTGDIMYDTFEYCRSKKSEGLLEAYNIKEEEFVLMTWHRQENTENPERMRKILDFISQLHTTIICPLHPRTRNRLENFGLMKKANGISNFKILDPIGYMDMVFLMNHCKYIVCDSGGLSKESYFAGAKCLFMLNFSPWPNLIQDGHIITIDFENEKDIEEKIIVANKLKKVQCVEKKMYYGNGKTAMAIVNIMEKEGIIKKR